MSENKINSYRLTSMEEPSDEMLAQLMKAAATEARQKSTAAHNKFFQEIRDSIRNHLATWSKEYKVTFTNV